MSRAGVRRDGSSASGHWALDPEERIWAPVVVMPGQQEDVECSPLQRLVLAVLQEAVDTCRRAAHMPRSLARDDVVAWVTDPEGVHARYPLTLGTVAWVLGVDTARLQRALWTVIGMSAHGRAPARGRWQASGTRTRLVA